MTRIFEALKKSQPAPAAVPFPPSAGGPFQPVPGRASAAAARHEPSAAPVFEEVTAAPLPREIARELTSLRVGLEAALEERPTRVVLFMSSVSREGTTTVASQFASLLAADSRLRVLALDLNARRPALASRFGATHGREESGGEEPRLSLVRSGSDAPGAGVSPIAARALITSVSGGFDWVVVDGPPVLEAPEITDVAPLAESWRVRTANLSWQADHSRGHGLKNAGAYVRKHGSGVLRSRALSRCRVDII